jgi:hypothetical protein
MTVRFQQNLFLLFFALLYFSMATPVTYAGRGIDAAWCESLIMAINQKMTFGRDFIFNYGPLGYLNFRLLPKEISPLFIILIDIFSILNVLFIINLCFEKAQKNWYWVAFLTIVVWLPWGFISDISFTFFYLFLFWILYAKQEKNTIGLLLALILSVFIFYIKVNLSIIVYSIFYLILIYFGITKTFKIKTLALFFIAQILITYLLSFPLRVDILGYLAASLQIIDAYQDAMATVIMSKSELISLIAFEGLIVLTFVIFIIKYLQFFKSLILLYLFIAIAGFLNFKQAHTAVSSLNVFGFFLFMPPLAVMLYLFTPNQAKRLAGWTFGVVLVLQLAATQTLRYYIGNHSFEGYKNSLNSLTFNPLRYFQNAIEHDYEKNFVNAPLQLPNKIKEKIGNQSVDFVQNDLCYIFFNRLNYNPRPIIQTYQANSAWLAHKNGEKYNSETAPEFVFFKLEPFREQNPFWMDGEVNLALLNRYNLTDTVVVNPDTLLLFQEKKEKVKSLIFKELSHKKYRFNDIIEIPKDSLVQLKLDVQYSTLGKLCRLVFQPPYLYCEVTYEDGKKENFRVIDKILKGGILINRKVTTNKDLSTFYSTKGKKNQHITKIQFWTKYAWGFEDSFDSLILGFLDSGIP